MHTSPTHSPSSVFRAIKAGFTYLKPPCSGETTEVWRLSAKSENAPSTGAPCLSVDGFFTATHHIRHSLKNCDTTGKVLNKSVVLVGLSVSQKATDK